MSQIRCDILRQHQKKYGQIKQHHIAAPIFDEEDNYDSNDLQNIEENLLVSDDNEMANEGELIDSDSEENVDQWNAIIARWREEVNQENRFENSRDECLLNGDLDNEFLVDAYDIHPAENDNLKWELSSIFIDDLEPPSCFNGLEMV